MDAERSTIRRCLNSIVKQFDYEKKELNAKALKELVGIVRRVDGIFPIFVDILFEQLRRADCDVRLCVLCLSGYFFQRSNNFRLEFINAIQDFLFYTLETDPIHFPMPGPTAAAGLLKNETIKMVRCWIDKFGAGYPKLQALENYLRHSKSLDWANLDANLQVDRERVANEEFKRKVRARKIIEKLTSLFDESRDEIERIQVEAHSVVELLLPRFCPIDGSVASKNQNANSLYVPIIPSSSVTIFLNPQVEIENSAETVDLVRQFRETIKQLEKWHSRVNSWLKKSAEVGDEDASPTFTRRLIDVKRALGEELLKCREFKVKTSASGDSDEKKGEEEESSNISSNDEEDDEFLDVDEKEGYEPELLPPNSSSKNKNFDDSFCSSIPGPSGTQKEQQEKTMHEQQKSQTSGKEGEQQQQRLDDIGAPPRLAMGPDLCYWDSNRINTEAQLGRNDFAAESWWRKCDEADRELSKSDGIPRQITFVTEPSELKRVCRTPLPSGRLCPRLERHSCALHGPIIDRDEQGFPLVEQLSNSKESERQEKRKAAEEAAYLRDVEAATGAPLGGRTCEKSRLSNGRTARERAKTESAKSRERLKLKLFDKRALKKVSETLGQIQRAKAESKFAHQFNYALTRK